jgi:hypothetical protein
MKNTWKTTKTDIEKVISGVFLIVESDRTEKFLKKMMSVDPIVRRPLVFKVWKLLPLKHKSFQNLELIVSYF